jgi:hypothetical protein
MARNTDFKARTSVAAKDTLGGSMRRFLFVLVLVVLTAKTAGSVLAPHAQDGQPQCTPACPVEIGPKADGDAVRAATMHRFTSHPIFAVHVVGDYALVSLTYPPAPSMLVFKRISGERWDMTYDGHLGIGMEVIRKYVPTSVANQLCSGKWPTFKAKQGTPSGQIEYVEANTSPC